MVKSCQSDLLKGRAEGCRHRDKQWGALGFMQEREQRLEARANCVNRNAMESFGSEQQVCLRQRVLCQEQGDVQPEMI